MEDIRRFPALSLIVLGGHVAALGGHVAALGEHAVPWTCGPGGPTYIPYGGGYSIEYSKFYFSNLNDLHQGSARNEQKII
jgi:hypothetical protein